MADKENKQVRQQFEAEKRAVINVTSEKNRIQLARRSAIVCRGYNRAWKHRIAEAAK